MAIKTDKIANDGELPNTIGIGPIITTPENSASCFSLYSSCPLFSLDLLGYIIPRVSTNNPMVIKNMPNITRIGFIKSRFFNDYGYYEVCI